MHSQASITAARIVLGLVFFVFGLNGFLHFIPAPPPEGSAGVFFAGVVATKYFLPLLAATQTIAGAALLARRYVPLALTVLAPVIVNIVAFHLFVAPSGMVIALLVLALEVFLAWSYRAAFVPMLRARYDLAATTGGHVHADPVDQHAH